MVSLESGETMKAAGLKSIATVLPSTAVLIKSKHPSNTTLVNLIASRIRGVIGAQKFCLCTYNVSRARMNEAIAITPGARAPTVMSLEGQDEDWVAVSSCVPTKRIADVMDDLTGVGARDILVMKLDNSRIGSGVDSTE
jgi:ATP phosphoribosyltransferase